MLNAAYSYLQAVEVSCARGPSCLHKKDAVLLDVSDAMTACGSELNEDETPHLYLTSLLTNDQGLHFIMHPSPVFKCAAQRVSMRSSAVSMGGQSLIS